MPDTVPATPAPAATSPAATPVAVPKAAPDNAAAAATPPAAEPTPVAAASPAQPAADKPAEVVESLIGGEAKPAETAPAEAAKPAEPTAYDLKLPEGVEVDASAMEAAKAIFTEGKVPPEIAQKLVSLQAEREKQIGQKMLDKQTEVWNTFVRDEQKKVMADPVLGGAKFPEAKTRIESGLQTFFGITPTTPANAPERKAHAEFIGVLKYTGAGSMLPMLRLLDKIASPRSEGRPAPVGGPSAPKKSPADILYQQKQAAE